MTDHHTSSVRFTGATLKVDPIVSDVTIVVKTPYDMAGTLRSDRVYLIDGVVDFTDSKVLPLDVPVGGLRVMGFGADISLMLTTEDNAIMFQSATSGSFSATSLGFTCSGVGSQIFALTSNTGDEAHEINRVNYLNCTSLGCLTSFRQGFESNTARFEGTPELKLCGPWTGGFFIDQSIVRILTDGAYSLFTAGVGLTFASRFRITANVDLPASVAFINFAPANLGAANLLQLTGSIVTRGGVSDPDDTNITPNIGNTALESFWKGNVGVRNTHVGGTVTSSGTAVTVISATGVAEDIVATWALSSAEHTDNPSGSQVRHLASSPHEFKVSAVVNVDGSAGLQLELFITKFSVSSGLSSTVVSQIREVVNLSGPDDIATFGVAAFTTLSTGDYLRLRIANNSNASNLMCLADSYMLVEER